MSNAAFEKSTNTFSPIDPNGEIESKLMPFGGMVFARYIIDLSSGDTERVARTIDYLNREYKLQIDVTNVYQKNPDNTYILLNPSLCNHVSTEIIAIMRKCTLERTKNFFNSSTLNLTSAEA